MIEYLLTGFRAGIHFNSDFNVLPNRCKIVCNSTCVPCLNRLINFDYSALRSVVKLILFWGYLLNFTEITATLISITLAQPIGYEKFLTLHVSCYIYQFSGN